YFPQINDRAIGYFDTMAEAEKAMAGLKPFLLTDKYDRIKGQFDSKEFAVEAARELVKGKSKTTISEKGISVEAAHRIGEARRMPDENISSDRLKDTFGFKGVNFGNWMKGDTNEAERQLHLNHAYDSFMDLAEVLGVPPEAMSLNGMLGLAIGAQGTGSAAAHFVPGVNEINLTRTSGAGSLAHEFAHAVDHYFGVQAGLAASREPFLSENTHMVINGQPIRPEIFERFKTIVKAMNKRPKSKAEIAKEFEASKERALKNLNGWIRYTRESFKDNEAEFDKLADKILKLDIGEGRISAGSRSFSPVVVEIRELHKKITGRVSSMDTAQSLQNTIDRYKFLMSEEGAQKSHIPVKAEIITDYAKAASKLDGEKGGKSYWSTNLEKFARAFDAFISDTLEERDAKNTYLSHAGRTGDTVPAGQERTAINEAFKELIGDLLTRKTEQGTALYSVSEDRPVVSILTGDEIKADSSGDLFSAASAFFKQNIQGRVVENPKIGPVRITGKGWHKMKRGLKTDPLKGKLIPAIPDIIQNGIVGPREEVNKRSDDIVAFYHIAGDVKVGNRIVQVGVTIGEDSRGNLFYNLNHDTDLLLAKKKAHGLPRSEARGREPSSEDYSSSEQKVTPDDGDVNLFVFESRNDEATLPGQGVTLQNIQTRFPNQSVGIGKDGSVWVRMKNGMGLTIRTVKDMGEGDYELAMRTGRLTNGGIILGKYQDKTITLNRDYASTFTRDHELEHFLEDVGLMTGADKLVLDGRIDSMEKAGKLNFRLNKDPRENRANFLAQVLAEREIYRSTALGRVLQKIADFLDGLLHIGRSSLRKVARGIESGSVYEKEGNGQTGAGTVQLSTTDDILTTPNDKNPSHFSEAVNFVRGVWENRKDLGPNYKTDLNLFQHIFGTTMYNSEKMKDWAYKRLYDALRKQPDYKYERQHDLWYEGDHSHIESIQAFQKKDKPGYFKLKNYLLNRDINAVGVLVKKGDDGSLTLLSEKKQGGKREKIGEFGTESEAWKAGIEYEVARSGLSDQGKDALRSFRKISHNLFAHYMEGMRDVIQAYDAAGQPLPDIAMETKDGTVKVALDVAMAQMGDRRGYYFPRLRKNGGWRVVATKKGVANEVQFFASKIQADGYRGRMKARGYESQLEKIGQFSEDVFASLSSLLSQQAVINEALRGIRSDQKLRTYQDLGLKAFWEGENFVLTGGVEPWMDQALEALGGKYREKFERQGGGMSFTPSVVFEKADKGIENQALNILLQSQGMLPNLELELAKAMVKQYETILKSRGSRSRMIGRSDATGLDVAQGYETDPLIAIARASQAAAGGYAKQRIAKEGMDAITGRDLSWQDYKAQNQGDDIPVLEQELESLRLATPAEKRKIAAIDSKIRKIRTELLSNKSATLDEQEAKQNELAELRADKKALSQFSDAKKAMDIKRQINAGTTGLYQQWLDTVAERRLDPKRQPRTFTEAKAALEDILKNEEPADRVIGTLKGLAVWQYLGFRVSSAAVNTTALVTNVPASMHGRGGIPFAKGLAHVGKALAKYGKYRFGTVDPETKKVFDEIKRQGWDAPKLNQEAFDVLQGQLGKGYGNALKASMWVFGVTEQMNRAATIAGAYWAMKEQNQGGDFMELMEKAKDIS
ncbi:MAG: LPD1 domain-containing protein, partial [Pseudomonadota bacterium]